MKKERRHLRVQGPAPTRLHMSANGRSLRKRSTMMRSPGDLSCCARNWQTWMNWGILGKPGGLMSRVAAAAVVAAAGGANRGRRAALHSLS